VIDKHASLLETNIPQQKSFNAQALDEEKSIFS
jgi:hypothetical protein